MVSKSRNQEQQVQNDKPLHTTLSPVIPDHDYSSVRSNEVTLRDIEFSMNAKDMELKHGGLSRESTLNSIKEGDESVSLDEEMLIASFQSITDIFGGERKDEDDANEKDLGKPIGTAKDGSFSRSEDADSLDEEVRIIMSKERNIKGNYRQPVQKTPKNVNTLDSGVYNGTEEKMQVSEEEDKEDEDEGAMDDLVDTETESEDEEDDEEDGEDKSVTEFHLTSGSPSNAEESDEEFDLDKYIITLCEEGTDSDTDSSDVSSVSSDVLVNKAVRKAMRPYKRLNSTRKGSISPLESSASENESNASGHKSDEQSSEASTSSCGSESELDLSDEASISTESSKESRTGMFEVEGLDPETSEVFDDEPNCYDNDGTIDPHDLVYTYYLHGDKETRPDKIELQDAKLGHLNTLGSRSVMDLRWPYSSYYIKEFNQDGEQPPEPQDTGLLPSYKSLQSSASYPGRRRNVMLGRVWWVEWWAKEVTDYDLPEQPQSNSNDTHL